MERKGEKWIRTVLKRHRQSVNGSFEWREEAKKGFNVYEGKQVEPNYDEGERSRYEAALNLTRPRVDTIVGVLTAGKPIPEISGRGMEDRDVADALKDIFMFSWDETNSGPRWQDAVATMAKCGLAILEEGTDDRKEIPTMYGNSVPGGLVLRERNPLSFYPDLSNRDPQFDGDRGADYYTFVDNPLLSQAIMLFPNSAEALRNMPKQVRANPLSALRDDYAHNSAYRSGYGGYPKTDDSWTGTKQTDPDADERVCMLTHYYREWEPVETVYYVDPDTEIAELAQVTDVKEIPVTDEFGQPVPDPKNFGSPLMEKYSQTRFMKAVDVPKGNNSDDPQENAENYDVQVKLKPRIRVCGIIGNELLYDRPIRDAHGRWPHVFITGTMPHDEPLPYGVIRGLFEVQTLFNQLNSLLIENAVKANNGGWKVEEGSLTKREMRKLRERGSEPGFILEVRRGRLRSVERLEPGQISSGLTRVIDMVHGLFDETSNVFQSQRGAAEYDLSGKSVIALNQRGDINLNQLQRNVEQAMTTWARMRLSNLSQHYTWERAWRISDQLREKSHFLVTQFDIPRDSITGQRMGDKPTLHLYKLNEDSPEPVEILKDMSVLNYDIKIRVSTEHQRSEQEKMQLVQYLRSIEAVDNEWVLEELGISGRKQLLERMKANNEVLQAGQKALQWMKQQPDVRAIVQTALDNPAMLVQVLRQAGIDPLSLLQGGGPQGEAGIEPPTPQFDGGRPQVPGQRQQEVLDQAAANPEAGVPQQQAPQQGKERLVQLPSPGSV